MKSTPPIPLFHLQERASNHFEIGVLSDIKHIAHWDQAHRDDNYLLLYQEDGNSRLVVDFQEITIQACAIHIILPGQVHYGLSALNSSAYCLAVDSMYIKDDYRMILSEFAISNASAPISPTAGDLIKNSLILLGNLAKNNATDPTINAMLEVCISQYVAACQNDHPLTDKATLRPLIITRQFRSLLAVHFRTMKGPSEYAAALNISPSYLNESVRETTSHPVSYWIHQEIILEAKRMLFHTNTTVKEIAHLLGFNDTTYFHRLFTKTAGMPPLQFRSTSRK